VLKEIATGINRFSKLPGCSDVVSSVWNGHNISEQVTFDCSIVCAVYIQHLRNISVSRFGKALYLFVSPWLYELFYNICLNAVLFVVSGWSGS
jgi:hypothetical protein